MVEIVEEPTEIEGDEIVTLDLGGTLVESDEIGPSSPYINRKFGLDAGKDEKAFQILKNEGHKEYAEFITNAIRDERRFNERPAHEIYMEAIQELYQDRGIVDGAEKFIENLKEQTDEIYILSSSPVALSRLFAEELDVNVIKWKDYEFKELGSGTIEFDRLYLNEYGEEGKHEILQYIQDEVEDVTHFGNGYNDLRACQMTGGARQWDWTENPGAFDTALEVLGD